MGKSVIVDRGVGRRGRSVVDDRGERLALRWLDRKPRLWRRDGVFDRGFQRAVGRTPWVFSFGRPGVRGLSTNGVFLVLGVVMFLFYAIEYAAWRGVVFSIMLNNPALIIATLMLVWPHHVVVHELLGRGRCGACRYELAGCPVDGDGCRVCPECGGAWRGEESGEEI